MTDYDALKSDLVGINDRLCALLEQADALPVTAEHAFGEWRQRCRSIRKQIDEKLIRVAVIGTIKSGKSSLINALFEDDYLKRGAGVVTSMVTRIRKGEQLKANLYFKSWDEVNAEMERALVLFPSLDWRSRKDKFDIRRESDRAELRQALGTLETRHLVTNDTRNQNSLILSGYISGYDRVEPILSAGRLTQVYTGEDFATHRDFSGNENLALYLKDICLEIDAGKMGRNMEIADCQGSDSPNPLHMAMIQDYLLYANLLIYVISSRTGVRQGDINFLSMIRKMGIMDNILFVINCDFNEHESLQNLQAVAQKIREDLSMIKNNAMAFTYSALYHLFSAQADRLSEKDRQRLAQWKSDAALVSFSTEEETRFRHRLEEIVTRHRYVVLLKNHFERLKMMMSALRQWIRFNQDVLARGADETAQLIKKLKSQQKKTNRVKSIVKNTLEGALLEIKKEIRMEADRFFDPRTGEVVPLLLDFVRQYTIPLHAYAERLESAGFSDTLYLVFQEFKLALDTFMAEQVNPKIFHFVKREEDKISEYFDSVSGPYLAMVKDALTEYNAALEKIGLGAFEEQNLPHLSMDIPAIKADKRLELPPASATMNYSAAIRTEAIMRLGIYNVVEGIRKLIRKSVRNEKENALMALKDASSRMKKETEAGLLFHFKNYRENIKFQYIIPLADAVSENIFRVLMDQFYDYTAYMSRFGDQTAKNQLDKEQLASSLQNIFSAIEETEALMARFSSKLTAAAPS